MAVDACPSTAVGTCPSTEFQEGHSFEAEGGSLASSDSWAGELPPDLQEAAGGVRQRGTAQQQQQQNQAPATVYHVAERSPPSQKKRKDMGWVEAFVQTLRDLSQRKNSAVLVQALVIVSRHVLGLGGLYRILRGYPSWRTGALSVGLWVVSGLGVTAGAHRLWSHQAYHATPAMQALLTFMFSMADQGSIVGWTLTHAMHHAESDTDKDPHNRMEGFWHAQFGWLFRTDSFRISQADYNRVINGHGQMVRWHDKVYIVWDPLVSLGLPSLIASFWGEALNGFFVAGAFRWMCVQHITFFVNSIAHGEREAGADDHAFDATATGIGPRVSLLTTLFALGEGWHDYHHIFPWDYAAAELGALDQWNPTKVFLDVCASLGLVSARRRATDTLQEYTRRQLLRRSGEDDCKVEWKTSGWPFFRNRVKVAASPASPPTS